MKFTIGTDKGSATYDSLDKSVPLEERFLALMIFKFTSGVDGVSADELGCTDSELESLIENGCMEDGDLDAILNPISGLGKH